MSIINDINDILNAVRYKTIQRTNKSMFLQSKSEHSK